MKQQQAIIGTALQAAPQAQLDLVVPFTTPELTLAALEAANRLGAGLNAGVRLLKVQVVPYPLDLNQSPVPLDFLKEQLRSFPAKLPTRCEVRLARGLEPGLLSATSEHSLVILATRRRPWPTRTERLASSLRRAGRTIVLVYEKDTPCLT